MLAVALICYFCGINSLAIVLFAQDKGRARSKRWRIPERMLLTVAFAGGAAGAKLAQHRLRHKTRKEPFRVLLNLAAGLNLVTGSLLFYPPFREALQTAFG